MPNSTSSREQAFEAHMDRVWSLWRQHTNTIRFIHALREFNVGWQASEQSARAEERVRNILKINEYIAEAECDPVSVEALSYLRSLRSYLMVDSIDQPKEGEKP